MLLWIIKDMDQVFNSLWCIHGSTWLRTQSLYCAVHWKGCTHSKLYICNLHLTDVSTGWNWACYHKAETTRAILGSVLYMSHTLVTAWLWHELNRPFNRIVTCAWKGSSDYKSCTLRSTENIEQAMDPEGWTAYVPPLNTVLSNPLGLNILCYGQYTGRTTWFGIAGLWWRQYKNGCPFLGDYQSITLLGHPGGWDRVCLVTHRAVTESHRAIDSCCMKNWKQVHQLYSAAHPLSLTTPVPCYEAQKEMLVPNPQNTHNKSFRFDFIFRLYCQSIYHAHAETNGLHTKCEGKDKSSYEEHKRGFLLTLQTILPG